MDVPHLETVLEKMPQSEQPSLEAATLAIEQNKHTAVTTAYYLSLKRFIRNGGKSNADITKYNPKLLTSQKRQTENS